MKKHILLFLLGVSLLTITSFKSYTNKNSKVETALTNKDWTFQKAESRNNDINHFINTLYNNSSYYFSSTKQYEEKFFEKIVDGEWYVDGHNLVLNKGSFNEEVLHIVEISDKTLKLSVIEKGESVTLIYE